MRDQLDEALKKIEEEKKAKKKYYSLRSLLGFTWAWIFCLLGARGIGKTYSVQDYICNRKRKKGDKVKIFWYRISETSVKQLLANKAKKLIDPKLVRKYHLDLTVKGNEVYNHGKPFCTVLPLSGTAKNKGVCEYDGDFVKNGGEYIVALDEFQQDSKAEKRSSFDLLYTFLNQLNTTIRKDKAKVFLMGNTVAECSVILKSLNFIPEKFGRFKLKRKHAIIDYMPPSQEYLDELADSVIGMFSGDKLSTFTNEMTKDTKLITKEPLIMPTEIIKFSKEKNDWFMVYNGNIIRRYKGEACNNTVCMTPYCNDYYNKELKNDVIERYDCRAWRFRSYIDQSYFQESLKLIRPR